MNRTDTTLPYSTAEALEARFARGIAARLSENAARVSPDIVERLRFAREKAVSTARARRELVVGAGGGAAVAGFAGSRWWWRIASALPLAALVAGLVLIQDHQMRSRISTAAEVDAALLGDDVPITAYRDPGFLEFLKAQPGE